MINSSQPLKFTGYANIYAFICLYFPFLTASQPLWRVVVTVQRDSKLNVFQFNAKILILIMIEKVLVDFHRAISCHFFLFWDWKLRADTCWSFLNMFPARWNKGLLYLSNHCETWIIYAIFLSWSLVFLSVFLNRSLPLANHCSHSLILKRPAEITPICSQAEYFTTLQKKEL